jgi:HK97 family phage major capsid protein
MELKQIGEAVTGLMTAFEEFKKTNDTRIKLVEAGKSVPEDLAAKLATIDASISSYQGALTSVKQRQAELDTYIESLKQAAGRSGKGGVILTPEQVSYKKHLDRYFRKGVVGAEMADLAQKTMSVDSEPDGGYWVTPDTGGRLVTKIYETSGMRQVASIQVISTDALEGPEDKGEVDGNWVTERGSRSNTNTTGVGKWRIEAHEMYAFPLVTQKLLDDASVDVESWLINKVGEKLGRIEAAAFVSGDGIGKPRGFLDYSKAATADATRTWLTLQYTATGTSAGFGATTNGTDKLLDLIYSLKAAYRQGSRFAMARLTVAEARKLKDGQGNYIWQPSVQIGQPATLMGYGIEEWEDMPAIAANSYSIAFGNFAIGVSDR